MSLVVGTNTSALYSQNALKSNARLTATAMERLSTGLRVNSAKDDAAGLAIGQNMTSQIRGLNQAVRNINDATNLLQTAEGGLNSVSNMLQRMRELAVQAANGTYSGVQRAYLQKEAEALQAQITKVVDTTTWNDKKLLDGSFTAQKIQVGADTGSTMSITLPEVTMDSGSPDASTIYGQFVVQFAYSGATPVMHNARLNENTGTLLTAIDANWASASSVTSNTTIRLSDFVYGGNGGPAGHGHITIAPGGLIPGETVNIDFTGDVYPWNAIYINYERKNGISKIKQVGSNSSGVTGITAKFSSNSTAALDLSSSLAATGAIGVLDSNLDTLNNTRATIGSYVNRLTYAADNATNMSTNLTASRSTIQDTDYAVESTNLARTQVIQEAATAMLAQANQQPQAVLALLKNL